MTVASGEQLPSITLDGKTYLLENLSDQARNLVSALAVAQQELNRLQAQVSITQTALQAYTAALKTEIGRTAG